MRSRVRCVWGLEFYFRFSMVFRLRSSSGPLSRVLSVPIRCIPVEGFCPPRVRAESSSILFSPPSGGGPSCRKFSFQGGSIPCIHFLVHAWCDLSSRCVGRVSLSLCRVRCFSCVFSLIVNVLRRSSTLGPVCFPYLRRTWVIFSVCRSCNLLCRSWGGSLLPSGPSKVMFHVRGSSP